MFSAEDYLQGWLIYAAGASCLLLFLWLVLRKSSWTTVRHLTMLFSAAVLLTPVTAYRDDSHLAPAFFVSLYEGLLLKGADAGFQRGLAPIIAVAFFALIGYLLIRLVWRLILKRRSGKTDSAKKPRGAKLHVKQDCAE